MKQITRNLITYRAEIHATADELRNRLPEFATLGPHQRATDGFVPIFRDQDERVLVVPGGWVICLREDGKAVPAQTVNEALEKKAAAIVEATGRKPGRKERNEIKADVIHDLLPQAFARTRLTYILYSERTQRLFVNANSAKVADLVMTRLVECLESLQTSTVHVSEPKMGLTKRLGNWLANEDPDDCFGTMDPADEIVMAGANGKWSVKTESLSGAENTLKEAMERGATVDSIGLVTEGGVSFRITSALRVKGVKHRVVEDDEDADITHCWVSQAASEIQTLDSIMDAMLELLSPEKAQSSLQDLFG